MTATEKIRELISSKGLKLNFVANELGISPYALALKLNNQNEFKSSEISIMCQLLDITDLKQKEVLFFKK